MGNNSPKSHCDVDGLAIKANQLSTDRTGIKQGNISGKVARVPAVCHGQSARGLAHSKTLRDHWTRRYSGRFWSAEALYRFGFLAAQFIKPL